MRISIILSGGVGSRMHCDIPKQYVMVNGQPIISFCLKTFFENNLTEAIVVVVADEWKDFVVENISKLNPQLPVFYAQPGETRQYSIYNALKVIKENGGGDDDIVLVHDAARPLVSHKLIEQCYAGCEDADAVMPVIPVKDTIYFSKNGKSIDSLLNRSSLWCGQAPEAFRFCKYLRAHDELSREELLKINGSTEIAFKSGLNCQMIEGDPMNFKITTLEDLSNFEALIKKQS